MNLLQSIFKDEKVIIQEIHDSFDNAQEELLKQAHRIIGANKPLVSDKAERLEDLGFVKSKDVVKNIEIKYDLLESEYDAELVNYYKSTYPFLKFLKEEQLESICKKYNLIFAPVDRYKEDVPEKNISQIENAQGLKKEDKPKDKIWTKIKFDYSWNPMFLIYNPYPKIIQDIHIHSWFSADEYFKQNHGYKREYLVSKVESHTINRQGLFIAAPKSHFDLKGLKNQKSGFFDFTITEVKDPIVFRYVRGGIQVLSKWGLEADDEMLQQEILN